MSILEEYEVIKQDILEYRNKIKNVIQNNSEENELCKGFTVWFSELKYNPSFLFIGINPGAGFFRNTGIKFRETDLDPSDCFEYCEYGGKLANETIELFTALSLYDELQNSVKTNIHYLVTTNQKDLMRLHGLLIDKHNINLYAKAEQWTTSIINIVQPKCIICEGAYSTSRIAEYYGKKICWNNDVCSYTINNNIFVIGYKRLYAGIINKKSLQNEIGNTYPRLVYV